MIEHPTWPDGDLIQIGHLFQRTGDDVHPVLTVSGIYKSDDRHRISWIDPDLGTTGPSVLTSEITRVLPPRPVAGDMPEGLALWLEQTELTAAELLDAGKFLSAARRKALSQLFEWAKGLLVVDEPAEDWRCGAVRVTPVAYEPSLYPCLIAAGHLGEHEDSEGDQWGDVAPPAEVVDAEIVADDRPQCDATGSELGDTWTCIREAGHSRRLLVNPTAGVETDSGHYDPERGWW